MQPLPPFIFGGARNSLRIEESGNGRFSVPLGKQGEDTANHSGSFRVHDQVALTLRVLLIAVEAKAPMWKPPSRRLVRTLRMFSDMSPDTTRLQAR